VIESIRSGLEKLNELSPEELDSLIASAYEAFEAADAEGDVEVMRETFKAAKTASAHKASLVAAAATVEEPPAAEPDAPAEPTETPAEDEPKTEETETPAEPEATATPEAEPQPEETPAEPASAPVEDPAPAAPAPDPAPAPAPEQPAPPAEAPAAPEAVSASAETPSEETKEETAMAASAVDLENPQADEAVTASAATSVVAAGDIKGFTAGSEFKDPDEVSRAFITKLNALRRHGGDGEQHSVASIVASFPQDRMLVGGDVEGNAKKIEAVTGLDAIVAAGGYCAPLQVRYDIYGLGSTARPVRDALAHFGTSRGGIRYVAPPSLVDFGTATGVWTAANDANPTTPTTKVKLIAECAEELTAVADAVTLQIQFGNFMARAFPELVTRNNELGLIQHARLAELTLLAKMETLSTAVTSGLKLGVARDFLLAVGKAGAAYRARHRIGRTTPLRVVAPDWVRDAMREDLAQGLPGDDNLAYADGVIDAFLSARNIRISWHMDGLFAAQTPGALVDFPSTFKWFIFSEGTFLFLDGGTLDLGVVRDSALVGTNDYIMFLETFEGVAKVGVEAMVVTQQSEVEGAVVGTVAPAIGS
jgi:hypothetical protein